MSNWIAISESLPDDDIQVLCFLADGSYQVAYCSDDYWYDADQQNPCNGVTHWMHLPDEPKPERSNLQRLLHPQKPSDWGVSVTLDEFLADPEGRREFSKYCPVFKLKQEKNG